MAPSGLANLLCRLKGSGSRISDRLLFRPADRVGQQPQPVQHHKHRAAFNQHITVARNLWALKESLPLRFISFGAVMYTLASFQGSIEALRSVNSVTHFTHYTVGHAHLGAYAFVTLVMFGAAYHMLPRMTGRAFQWPALINAHFWLVVIGFTPCVLPMYPILSATLAREGEALTARRGFVLSSAYVLAMAAAFGLLGIFAAWSGQNLQMVLQSPYAIGAVGVLFVVLAASMFGLFELQLPSAWVNRMAGVTAGRRGSVGGAAGMGFLSALIVGPCVTAPLAAALLYIAQTGDAFLGAAALFALGLGQGIPLIAFGAIGSRALPRAGAWMVQVKYVFGFVFLGAAIWMSGRILPPSATLALWAILLLTAAVFIGVADRLTADADAGPRFRKAAGFALSLAGVILAIGAASGGSDPLRPLAHLGAGVGRAQPQVAEAETTFIEAGSMPDLMSALASADGRPTFVYFTADWCVICKTIERDVLPDAGVIASLDGFQRVKVDLTALDPANQEMMRDLAVVGPPTMIFFDSNSKEASGSRLIGDATVGTLQTSLELARR